MIGDIIKKHRKKLNMSKRELAEKLSVHESLISKYENTAVDLPLSKFKQISYILDINPLELLEIDLDDNRKKYNKSNKNNNKKLKNLQEQENIVSLLKILVDSNNELLEINNKMLKVLINLEKKSEF